MEFLIVVGFAFLMTIPLIALFYRQSENINSEVTSSQMDKVASEIRDAADEVYYLGSPSKKTITVFIPENLKCINMTGSSIIFRVASPGGDYDLVKWTAANLTTSTFCNLKGIHYVSTEAQESGNTTTVNILIT